MQRTMLEAKTMMATLTTAHLSTLTTMQTTVRSAHNDDNTGYCANLSTMTTMQTTALEAPTTVTPLATATSSAH